MSQTLSLTRTQLDEFARRGLLRLSGLLPTNRVHQACAALWPADGLSSNRTDVNALFEEPALLAAVDALLDGRPFDRTMYKRPQLLFTPPNAGVWTMPRDWHVDCPRFAGGERPGVQLFAFLDVVEPRGGGTLVVAGSHRLLNEAGFVRPRNVRRLLQRESFFRELFSQVLEAADDDTGLPTGAAGDVALEVVELTGAPGDAYFVDLRVLHASAPNAGDRPRMMATRRYLREDLVQAMAAGYGWAVSDG